MVKQVVVLNILIIINLFIYLFIYYKIIFIFLIIILPNEVVLWMEHINSAAFLKILGT